MVELLKDETVLAEAFLEMKQWESEHRRLEARVAALRKALEVLADVEA